MSWLADTNVLSELARREPDPGVARWASGVVRVHLSVVTVEELCFGLAWKPLPRVDTWLGDFLAHDCEILPVTAPIARRAGELRGRHRARGSSRHQADMLIAATASVHGLTLVTRNHRDFDGCGIAVLDPFTAG
jgi:predicted nucleic acid-binding protein